MKTQKLNYDFSIRSIEATKVNHSKRIEKLLKNKDTLKSMIENLENENEDWMFSNIDSSRNYCYYDRLNIFRKEKKQKQLKELKSFFNYNTINHIKYLLKSYNMPESYFTAFYCIYYKRINKLMKQNLKSIV